MAALVVRRLVRKVSEETSRLMSSVNWLQLLIAVVLMLLFALAALYWTELQ